MALDQVCVVTRSDRLRCQNQDVLFLGTGTHNSVVGGIKVVYNHWSRAMEWNGGFANSA